MFFNLRKKIKTKEKTDYKNFKSFKATFRTVFISKIFLVFGIIFLLGSLLLYFQYTDTLKAFALSEQIFLVGDIEETHPIDLLSHKFSCDSASVNQKCNNYSYVLILLFLLLPLFAIFLLFRYWKKVSKIFLAVFLLLLQLLLIIPFAVLLFAPNSVFNALAKDANKEITKTLQVLITPEGRKKMGIEDNLQIMKDKLVNQKDLPYLAETDPRGEAILQSLGITHNNKNTLYRAAIIPYQVYFAQEIATQKERLNFEALLFPTNSLVVYSINEDVLEQLIPVLAEKIVRSKFEPYLKNLKTVPVVDVLEEEDYLAIRAKQKEKEKKRLETQVREIQNALNQLDASIEKEQRYVREADAEYSSYEARYRDWFADCVAVLGNDSQFCQDGKGKISENLQTILNDKRDAEKYVEEAKSVKPSYITNLELARHYYDEFLKNPNSPGFEDGIFLSPNMIYIKYQPSKDYPFTNYFSMAIHEYLHFFSFVTSSGDDSLPVFIDEGITDYLTVITIDSFLNRKTQYISYVNEVEIIKKIVEIISDEKLREIYFSKSEGQLKELIDGNLSKGKYEQIKSKGGLLSSVKFDDEITKENFTKEILSTLSTK